MSDIRKILNIINETTSSGAVATGPATNLFMNKRTDEYAAEDSSSEPEAPKVLEYGNWENSALTTSKKLKQTRKKASKAVKSIYDESLDGVAPSTAMFTTEGATKTRNPVAKAAQRVAKGSGKHKNPAKTIPRKQKYKPVYEEENLSEMDLIVSPSSKSKLDRALISKDRSYHDREVEMARGDLFQAAKNAAEVLKLIKDRSEMEGLEGWVQEKIVKASDYLNTIREYLQNKSVQHRLQSADSMELEEDAGEQTYPPAPDWLKEILAKPEFQIAENIAEQDVIEGFKNTYNVGDRVETSMGSGVITTVSKNINIDGKVKVKLDDPSRAGEDGKYKDEFVFTTNMLKHLPDQGVAEGADKDTLTQAVNLYREFSKKYPHKIAVDKSAKAHDLDPNKLNNYIDHGKYHSTAKSEQDVAEGIFDRFKKKPEEPKDPSWEKGWELCNKDPAADVGFYLRKHGAGLDRNQFIKGFNANAKSRGMRQYGDWGDDGSGVDHAHSLMRYKEIMRDKGVIEGSEKHKQSRLWAMISDYEQRAKATKNDIKKQHYMKMADQLRGKLKTSDDQDVTEDKGSIIDKCASLAAKYFNSEGLQREYDIDEFIKNNAGTDPIINKCASLAAKYFNSDGLQNQYDIDEYIKANVKQDVTKDKPSDSK